MTKNQNARLQQAFRRYIHTSPTPGYTATAGHYRQKRALFDLKAICNAIASQGEQINVSKAILTLDGASLNAFRLQPAFIASEASIADVAGGGTTLGENLDDGLDLMTAGDYEFRALGDVLESHYEPDPSNSVVSALHVRVEITEAIQKACAMLVRSVYIDDNFEYEIVVDMIADTTGATLQLTGTLQIDYQLVAKPFRLLP